MQQFQLAGSITIATDETGLSIPFCDPWNTGSCTKNIITFKIKIKRSNKYAEPCIYKTSTISGMKIIYLLNPGNASTDAQQRTTSNPILPSLPFLNFPIIPPAPLHALSSSFPFFLSVLPSSKIGHNYPDDTSYEHCTICPMMS